MRDVERLLQMMATNGEHVVWKDGEENLKLCVWKDGKCYHLPMYKKEVCSEPNVSATLMVTSW